MPGGPRNNVAFTVLVSVLTAVGGLAVVGVLAASGRPGTVLISALLAFVPVVPLVLCFLWLDRYEPEPRKLLWGALLWGAFVATSAAMVLQLVLMLLGFTERANLVIGAPITEEATKGAFLLLMLWWRRHELDGVLDGIVYGGLVGVGFAFTENILYLTGAADAADELGVTGAQALTGTFIMRCLMSPFAHPLFTIMTGIAVGIAVGSRSGTLRALLPVVGYCCAVAAHATWNGSTLIGGEGFLAMYVVLALPALLLLVGFAIWARSSERKVLTAALGDAAARGLIPASDIGWLADLGARRRMRTHVRAQGGPQAERALADYQQAAIELGFLHSRYLRGTAPRDFAARGQEHVRRIEAARPYFAFPGQVVPTR